MIIFALSFSVALLCLVAFSMHRDIRNLRCENHFLSQVGVIHTNKIARLEDLVEKHERLCVAAEAIERLLNGELEDEDDEAPTIKTGTMH